MENQANKSFELDEKLRLKYRLGFTVKYLAIPLVLGFLLVDYFYVPDQLTNFLLIRLLILPVAILILFLNRTSLSLGNLFLIPSFILILWLSLYNTYLIAFTGYEKSLYWTGLVLITIGSLGFFPIPPRRIPVLLTLNYLPFLLLMIFRNDDFELIYFMVNISFIVSVIIITSSVSILSRQSRFKEWVAQQEITRLSKQQSDIVRRTVQMLAHDIKVPFTMVKYVRDLLPKIDQNGLRGVNVKLLHDRIDSSCYQVESMITDLLELDKPIKLHIESLSLQEIINSLLSTIEPEKKILIENRVPEEHIIYADKRRIQRVFLNLLNNAFQYASGKYPKIYISLKEEGDIIRYIVGNSGILPKDVDPANLLEPFYTLSHTGTGLGLAICSSFVKAHGGEIAIEQPEGFVEFHVILNTQERKIR